MTSPSLLPATRMIACPLPVGPVFPLLLGPSGLEAGRCLQRHWWLLGVRLSSELAAEEWHRATA